MTPEERRAMDEYNRRMAAEQEFQRVQAEEALKRLQQQSNPTVEMRLKAFMGSAAENFNKYKRQMPKVKLE